MENIMELCKLIVVSYLALFVGTVVASLGFSTMQYLRMVCIIFVMGYIWISLIIYIADNIRKHVNPGGLV